MRCIICDKDKANYSPKEDKYYCSNCTKETKENLFDLSNSAFTYEDHSDELVLPRESTDKQEVSKPMYKEGTKQ